MSDITYKIRAFAGRNHLSAPYGVCIFSVRNTGEASKEMEVSACISRIKKGEISKAIVYIGDNVVETIDSKGRHPSS